MKRIKNNTLSNKTWAGMEVLPGAYYEIEEEEINKWRYNVDVLASLANGEALMNNGSSDLVDPDTGITFLKGVIRQAMPMSVDPEIITVNLFQKISQIIWLSQRNASFQSGNVLAEVICPNNIGVQIRVVDATNNVVLGTSPLYTTSGIKSFPVNNPTSDCRIEVQAKHNSILGVLNPPEIHCLILEWDT